MRSRYRDCDDTGQFAIMRINDPDTRYNTDGIISRYRAIVMTGPNRKKDCLVLARMPEEKVQVGIEFIARLNMPRMVNRTYRSFLFGNSVTTDIPDDFEYAEAKDVLCWGNLEKRMHGHTRPGTEYFPNKIDVNKIFDIADIYRLFLIWSSSRKATVPISYYLFGDTQYDFIDKDVDIALADYIHGMRTDQNAWTSSPRVMMINDILESELDMKRLMQPERIGVKHCIRMDPAARFQVRKTES